MADVVDNVLTRLAVLIGENRYEPLETDGLEIKPVPPDTGSWRERHKTVNAFLNTRGGILLLGFKEQEEGVGKRWVFTGYREEVEEKLKEFSRLFTARDGKALDLREAFPPMQLRDFPRGKVAVVYVDELPADQKYVFYRGEGYKRVLTGDHKLNEAEIISIKPGSHVSIRNPGSFRRHLLIEAPDHAVPLRRIIPEAKARNPKLADVLRVYRKWEGKGIGMATLVNLCLENRIDLPSYRLYSEEVCLVLTAGPLFGERMKTHLAGFDAHLEGKLGGKPSAEQMLILTYLMKSEWANRTHHYTILLTPDNNHFEQLLSLERAGLIFKHERSTLLYPVYLADRVLVQDDYRAELEAAFGTAALQTLEPLARRCLDIIYRHGKHSSAKSVTAKMAAFAIWFTDKGGLQNIKQFDAFYRKVRNAFNKLEANEFILRASPRARGFLLNETYRHDHLL